MKNSSVENHPRKIIIQGDVDDDLELLDEKKFSNYFAYNNTCPKDIICLKKVKIVTNTKLERHDKIRKHFEILTD